MKKLLDLKSFARPVRLLALLLAVLTVASACSGPDRRADKVVARFMDDLRDLDYAQASSSLVPGTALHLLLPAEEDVQPGTRELIGFSCSHLEYKITGTRIEGDSARVQADITVPDVTGLLQQYLREALMMALIDTGDDDLRTLLQNLLLVKVGEFSAAGGFAARTSQVEFLLVYSDKQWRIQNAGNLEFAMIGGFEQLFEPAPKP